MIFRDSRIVVEPFVAASHRTAFLLSLQRCGIADVEWLDSSTVPPIEKNRAVIRVMIFGDIDSFLAVARDRRHAVNEEFVDVFLAEPRRDGGMLQVHWEGDGAPVAEAICRAEQLILQRNQFQSDEVPQEFYLNFNLLGRTEAYVQAMQVVEKVAATDVGVFIRGETGTGKELTARAIHYLSERARGPFVPINCGAFTGADSAKPGLLEIADKGTVFLDEVDALSPMAQVALLRFLQDREVRPVGGSGLKLVDVRVLCASNKDTREQIESGRLREDLVYRLDVLNVNLPPLRQRTEDLHLLAQYFLAQLALDHGQPAKVFSSDLIDMISRYEWPGNVRELQNFVYRNFLMSDEDVIDDPLYLATAELQSKPRDDIASFNQEKQALIEKFERDYLQRLLKHTKGNISRAAAIANKERRSFSRLMSKHGLKRSSFT